MDKRRFLDFVNLIDEPNRSRCLRLYEDHKEKIVTAFGSKSKHQAWKGGYRDHVKETMEFAVDLYQLYEDKRNYQFTLSDALLTLFLHDIEKSRLSIAGPAMTLIQRIKNGNSCKRSFAATILN